MNPCVLSGTAFTAGSSAHRDTGNVRPLLPLLLFLWCAGGARAETYVAHGSAGAVLQRVLVLVNEVRAGGYRCGRRQFPPVQPLVRSDLLGRAAQQHAGDMARLGYFGHRAPDGSEPRDRVRRVGYRSRLTGENIAFGPESAEEVVRGWLQSPGHCENIMDSRFEEIGVGFATGSRPGHIYWVQNFGSPNHVQ
jgi:uncharacterized protein YkwD